jgi:hypothetical protein
MYTGQYARYNSLYCFVLNQLIGRFTNVISMLMDDCDAKPLPCGSVLAILAPDKTCWLAATTEDADVESMRISVRWLARVKSRRNERMEIQCFCIDKAWSETFVWRDCILVDLSPDCTLDELGNWHIEQAKLDYAQSLVELDTDIEPADSSRVSSPNISNSLSEETFCTLLAKCSDGIQHVSVTQGNYRYVYVFGTCVLNS